MGKKMYCYAYPMITAKMTRLHEQVMRTGLIDPALLCHFDGSFRDEVDPTRMFASSGATFAASKANFGQAISIGAHTGSVSIENKGDLFTYQSGDFTVEAQVKIPGDFDAYGSFFRISETGSVLDGNEYIEVWDPDALGDYVGPVYQDVNRSTDEYEFCSICNYTHRKNIHRIYGGWYIMTTDSDTGKDLTSWTPPNDEDWTQITDTLWRYKDWTHFYPVLILEGVARMDGGDRILHPAGSILASEGYYEKGAYIRSPVSVGGTIKTFYIQFAYNHLYLSLAELLTYSEYLALGGLPVPYFSAPAGNPYIEFWLKKNKEDQQFEYGDPDWVSENCEENVYKTYFGDYAYLPDYITDFNTSHHLAFVKNGGQYKLFIDGVRVEFIHAGQYPERVTGHYLDANGNVYPSYEYYEGGIFPSFDTGNLVLGFNISIDELAIDKTARYTENFTADQLERINYPYGS